MGPQLGGIDEAAEDAGQQDAVVGAVRLVAEHAYGEAVGGAREQLLDDAGAGHASTDNHDRRASCLNHGGTPGWRHPSRITRTRDEKLMPLEARAMPEFRPEIVRRCNLLW